jgi:hypothetical protein
MFDMMIRGVLCWSFSIDMGMTHWIDSIAFAGGKWLH